MQGITLFSCQQWGSPSWQQCPAEGVEYLNIAHGTDPHWGDTLKQPQHLPKKRRAAVLAGGCTEAGRKLSFGYFTAMKSCGVLPAQPRTAPYSGTAPSKQPGAGWLRAGGAWLDVAAPEWDSSLPGLLYVANSMQASDERQRGDRFQFSPIRPELRGLFSPHHHSAHLVFNSEQASNRLRSKAAPCLGG